MEWREKRSWEASLGGQVTNPNRGLKRVVLFKPYITSSGLRTVLSTVNSHIGDRLLPELKLSMRGLANLTSHLLSSIRLVLNRRGAFKPRSSRSCNEPQLILGSEITHDALSILFKETYSYESPSGRLSLKSFKLDHAEGGTHLTGKFMQERISVQH